MNIKIKLLLFELNSKKKKDFLITEQTILPNCFLIELPGIRSELDPRTI